MRARHSWTTGDDAFLAEHYPTKGSLWCAAKLGVTEQAVRARAHKTGVSRPRRTARPRAWTDEETRAVTYVLDELARRLGRTPASVVAHYWDMTRRGGAS